MSLILFLYVYVLTRNIHCRYSLRIAFWIKISKAIFLFEKIFRIKICRISQNRCLSYSDFSPSRENHLFRKTVHPISSSRSSRWRRQGKSQLSTSLVSYSQRQQCTAWAFANRTQGSLSAVASEELSLSSSVNFWKIISVLEEQTSCSGLFPDYVREYGSSQRWNFCFHFIMPRSLLLFGAENRERRGERKGRKK